MRIPEQQWLRDAIRGASNLKRSVRFVASGYGLPWAENVRRLRALRDVHAGRRAFLIGNGPSLNAGDLERLAGEITFASNKIYLIFDKTSWRPTYYGLVDMLGLRNNLDEIAGIDSTLLLPVDAATLLEPRRNMLFYCERNPRYDERSPAGEVRFSGNAVAHVYGGHTVSYNLMQLAFHTGIRELYLLGFDHSWQLSGPRSQDAEAGTVLVGDRDSNHFDPNYLRPNETWAIPKVPLHEMAYAAARRHYERHGGRILNSTRGGQLEVFERVDFERISTD